MTTTQRTTKSQVTNSLKMLSRFSGQEYVATFGTLNTIYVMDNQNVERYIISGTKTELWTYIHFAIDIVSRMNPKN